MIIGIDGGTWQIFDDYLLENHMPNLNSLKKRGFWGVLESTDPAVTPPAWTTCITGCQPSSHGIIGFAYYNFVENRTKISSSINCRVPTMFEYLSDNGYKVASVHIPWTFPCRKVNGVVVAGFGTPGVDCDFTYPKDFKQKILSRFPDYRSIPELDYSAPANLEVLQSNLDEFERCVEQRTEIASMVCEQVNPDVMMVQFQSIDVAGHLMWLYMDSATRNNYPEHWSRICKTFEKFDQAIGDILKLVKNDDAIVCVVSDHGLYRLKGIIRPNAYLRDWGYLKFANPFKRMTSRLIRKLQKLMGKNHPILNFEPRLIGKRRSILNFEPKTPVNWKKTRAIMNIMGLPGHIYINLENRRPGGKVKQGREYEQLLDELSSRFLALRGPDGDGPLFSGTLRSVKLYNYGSVDQEIASDLVLIPSDGYVTSSKVGVRSSGMTVLPAENTCAAHEHAGMYIFNGPNVRTGQGPGHIVDIMPSIFAMLGVAIPECIDGRPMQDIFREPISIKYKKTDGGQKKQTDIQEVLSQEQEIQILKRLTALGYAE